MPKRIRCVIDTRDLRISKTGARTYLEEICRQMQKGAAGFDFYFADTWIPVYTGGNKLLKIIEHIRYFAWKQFCLPAICFIRRADILYCTDYFLPLIKLNYKTAVVFHDAFFWEYPEQYNFFWLRLLNTIGLAAAKKADAVITITEYSKKQLVKYTGISVDKIHAIHLAPKSMHRNVDVDNALFDPEKKYILHVGVLEKRKNLLTLIRAFHLLLIEGYDNYSLILAGSAIAKEKIDDSSNIHALIRELRLEERVILTGFISDEHLAYYYKNAEVYAFVSVNEGFGLPVLEAFENNLPTLISDNSCLPEVGGDAVITCNPFDETDIKDKIKLIINNPALQEELIEKGRKRLTLFSWETTFNKLLDVFKVL